jgi:hypothetical protein
MRCRLLLGHGCPASSSFGEEGDGTNPEAALPPRGEDVAESAAAGRADDRRCCCRAAEEGVPCHSYRRGTLTRDSRNGAASQAEEVAGDYPSGTRREVVRQHAAGPYLAHQLSAFRPRGVPGPTSEIVAACPSPDGLARDGTQRGGNRGSFYPAPEWVRL